MLERYSFACPTKMEFGPGALAKLPQVIEALHGSKVMLVTDPGVVQAGLLDRVKAAIGTEYPYVVFDRVRSDPDTGIIGEIYEQAQAAGAGQAGPDMGGQSAGNAGSAGGDDVVDADFKEV